MAVVHTIAEIGALARERRKTLGYTQVQVAGLCGTGTRFISDLENGKGSVEFGKALSVLQALGLDLSIQARGEGK
jgi:HTH-type transcriptional regulator / antitoxin HipB